jgi:trigger factor
LPGFRQGRVPRALLEKRFGQELRADVAKELFGRAVEKALKDHQLELVSEPEVAARPSPPESGQDLAFTFEVEVKPTFDLPEYKGIEVTRRVRSVEDGDVDRFLEDLRLHRSVLKPVAAGTGFEPGDWALTRVTVREDGREPRTLDHVPIGGPRPAVKGFDVPGLAGLLSGKKTGDTFAADATALRHEGHEGHEGHGWHGPRYHGPLLLTERIS